MRKVLVWGILILAFGILFSCSKSTKQENGTLIIYLTDSSGNFEAVNIVVSEVSVHMSDSDSMSGWKTICDTIQHFDLLKLQNGATALFGKNQLIPGHYTQIRLKIGDGSNVIVEGDTFPLVIPSGYQTGIKLNHQFTINAGEIYELLLDFDAERSIVQTGTYEYKLKPVIRVVPQILSGSIKGIVIPHFCDILTISGSDTISHTKADTSTGFFKITGLLAGQYDLHFLPEGILYVDSIIYDVNVTAGNTTDLDTIRLRHLF